MKLIAGASLIAAIVMFITLVEDGNAVVFWMGALFIVAINLGERARRTRAVDPEYVSRMATFRAEQKAARSGQRPRIFPKRK